MNDQLDRAVRSVLADIVDTAPQPPEQPARLLTIDDPATERRRPVLGAAAAVIAVAGIGGVALLSGRSDAPAPAAQPPETAATIPSTTPLATPPPSSLPPCDDTGCRGFDRLPVAPGATDYYVGPAHLGTPTISTDWFDTLTRCVELSDDFATCEKIEGIAGVNLVGYPDAQGEIAIGTTFTDLTPADYAAFWGPSRATPDTGTRPTVVRGHDAISYTNEIAPGVVWQERPGVLVWVTVPAGSGLDPTTVAEGIQRVDGPASIPNRVVVQALARPWDAQDNDGDGLVVATAKGQGCVGLNYVDTCGDEIGARTIVRPSSSGAVTIAGSTPADVATIRIEITGSTPIDVETITFADYPSRFYSTVVTSGAPQKLTWLDADGAIIDSMEIALVPVDTAETVPPGLLPSSTSAP